MTPDQVGLAIADRFMSGAYAGRDNLAMHISSAIQQAIRKSYEDAARVAERKAHGFPPVEVACSYNLAHNIAKAIRARIKD
jgi:hypothetical protein